MALKKTYKNAIGIPTEYFRIADINENYINPEPVITVYVKGYADATYRDTEKKAKDKDVDMSNFTERYTFLPDDTKGYGLANMYGRLKNEVEFFKDSTDL